MPEVTALFGSLYGGLFAAFGDASWWIGALTELAHGLFVGAMFMPMMPTMHPRMSPSVAGAVPGRVARPSPSGPR